MERARGPRRVSQSSPSRVLPASEHMQYSLADLDLIYRDPQDFLFNIEPQDILEQGMVESQEVLDSSMFEPRETPNHLLDEDNSDCLGEAPAPSIADNFDVEDMDIDMESDVLPDFKPPEPDFDRRW